MSLSELKRVAEGATPHDGYTVDANGHVWSSIGWRGQRKRMLTPQPNSHGYLRVKVKVGAAMKTEFVHRLVCIAFHGPRPTPAHQVRHLDGNPRNNRADNLAWGTVSENAHDRKTHGTERAADNGRRSAIKLRGRVNPLCLRGHNKEGRRSCEQCRRGRRAHMRGNDHV